MCRVRVLLAVAVAVAAAAAGEILWRVSQRMRWRLRGKTLLSKVRRRRSRNNRRGRSLPQRNRYRRRQHFLNITFMRCRRVC